MANISIKEHLLSQGKLVGETSVLTGKALEAIQNTYEGIVAMNENQKEGNSLLKELIEGQRIALRQATQNILQQTSAQQPYQAPSVAMGSQGTSTIPAAFQNPPPAVAKIPGTNIPHAAAIAARSKPGTAPTTPAEDSERMAPGFKRVKLADGQYMTIPKNWQPDAGV